MIRRVAVSAWGIVQGVGFRPFVYVSATSKRLTGWVRNEADAVRLEVQGRDEAIRSFLFELASPPAAARVERIEAVDVPLQRDDGFRVLESRHHSNIRPTVPADLAICADCAAEMNEPACRRHRYPFTTCARCGPRLSMIEALPYDRARTTMSRFALCRACEREYGEPADRRFHAQSIACPDCGPRLALVDSAGKPRAEATEALEAAAGAVLRGEVLALKALGGFQLLTDATSHLAIARLRERKRRPEKPFAVMFGSLDDARAECALSAEEERALVLPEAPIVLVRRIRGAARRIVAAVAPGSSLLGAMLPYTGLHRLILEAVGRPLVCTSGNLSEEPMCIDYAEARIRLGGIADVFLVHDQPILRPMDDSVVRVDADGVRLLRRARGYAPLPLHVPFVGDRCILATGAHLKSTVALAKQGDVVVSQHIGDLSSTESVLLLERTARDLMCFFGTRPELLACDQHPDYVSTRLAETLAAELDVPLVRVQHHHAHVAACMAEHGLSGPVLGLAWDGAGLGTDGTLWGGEALVVDGASFRRFAHLRSFPLPGGGRAMRDPSRAALGLLHELFGRAAVERFPLERRRAEALLPALERGFNAPRTSSMGRLFDAVSALAGVRAQAGYEGQAALELELAADGACDAGAYPIELGTGDPAIADWAPLVEALLDDRARRVEPGVIAARFHAALAGLAEAMAERASLGRVVLTGGCFQNARLLSSVGERLRKRGLEVFVPRRYPANDGGLSLGQLYVAALREGAA